MIRVTTKEATNILIQRCIMELSIKGKQVDKVNLFENKAYCLYFLKLIIGADNALPKIGLFFDQNKQVIQSYRNAILLLKTKIKRRLSNG